MDLKKAIDQGGKGTGVGRWRKMLKTIDSYSNTAIQSNPVITTLVWAGVRAILQVFLNVLFGFIEEKICYVLTMLLGCIKSFRNRRKSGSCSRDYCREAGHMQILC